MLDELDYFLKEHKMTSQLSALGTPWKNGVIERRNQTIVGHDEFFNTPYILLGICLGHCYMYFELNSV